MVVLTSLHAVVRSLPGGRAWLGGRVVLLTMIIGAAGCIQRRAPQEVNPDRLADMEFQAYLADVPLVSVADAYRAMLILADGSDTSKSFEERKEKLESRGIARAAWKLEPDNVIDKGSVAFMTMSICRMRGGVNTTLFGSWGLGDRRYAMREMIYQKMLDDAAVYQFMTGGELVAMMSRADTYMASHKLYESKPIELGPEPAHNGSNQPVLSGTP